MHTEQILKIQACYQFQIAQNSRRIVVFFSREGQSNFNFFTFFFFSYDSQPRFPLSTTIIQQSFLLLHQNNNNCWNQSPIKTKLSLKEKVQQNHHHFPPNKKTLLQTLWKLGGSDLPQGDFYTPWNDVKARKTGQILFISIHPWKRETTEPSGNRSMDSALHPSKTNPLPSVYNHYHITLFLFSVLSYMCPTSSETPDVTSAWYPDHHHHHQSLLIVYKVKPSITNHYNQKRQPSTPF